MSKSTAPTWFQAIAMSSVEGIRDLTVGKFLSPPPDHISAAVFFTVNLRYDPVHQHAFNQAIEIKFQQKSIQTTSNTAPKPATFGLYLLEGVVTGNSGGRRFESSDSRQRISLTPGRKLA